MQRTLAVIAAAMLTTVALLPAVSAHQDRIPGAIVLNEDNPLRPRCYIFSAPLTAQQGIDSVQFFVEKNGKLTGGVPNGTGPTNTRTATIDKAVEGFLDDIDELPDTVPLEETVVGDGSGLQHPNWRFNTASEDPAFAANHSDTRLSPAGFAQQCL